MTWGAPWTPSPSAGIRSNQHPSIQEPRTVMSNLPRDLRFALRFLRRSPLHALITVLILGVGIGSVTLMFSVLNASVLRPLPFPEPDRLVWLWKASDEVQQNSVSYDDFRDYRGSLGVMGDLAAYQLFYPRPLLSGTEAGIRVQGNQVTPNLFSVLGIAPTMGRNFRWEGAVAGGPAVTILSHAFWQGQFGGDPGIVGRVLSLDGRSTEVVGVMPEGFAFPSANVQLWLPTREGEGATLGRGNNNFFVIGRLKDDVALDVAQAQVDAAASRIQEAHPDHAAWFHWLQPLHTVLFGDTRAILLLLLGIVALFPGEDPLGQPVLLWGQPFRVVGVSARVDEAGLGDEGRPAFFLSADQVPQEGLRVAIRTAGADPLAVAGAVRGALREQDPDITLAQVQSMEDRIGATLAQPRFRTGMVSAFALVGLLLAAVGLYRLLAYLVTLRRHEIGIRVALGAGRNQVLGLIVTEGMRMVGVGIALGLAMGAGVSVFLRGLLFGVAPADPLSLGGSSVVLLVTAVAAAMVPALRALRVNPLEALRAE
jgi:hypothetical protein